jgi:TonB-dependent starch-binding outer membrane protein SusC
MSLISQNRCKKMLVILFTLCAPFWLAGQRTITGTVTDIDSGEGLIGANVLIVGATALGTVTDIDGKYTLEVPEGYTTIRISYTGYAPVDVELGASDIVDVTLSAGQILEEVTVIGYGSVNREDVTGSVQTVDAEEFNKGFITSAQQLLAGKVAGVSITTGGSPGAGSKIRIRGESSLSASNDPLIVIDGMPIDNGGISGSRNGLNMVNPNDIESITVLKDASASAIYGNRAAGGVIIITTKEGKVDEKLKVNYTGNVSWGIPVNEIDVLNAEEYKAAIADQFEEDHPANDLLGESSTDWQDEIYRTAFGNDNNLSLRGGAWGMPFRVSLGYTTQEGILQTDKFSRFTGALALNPSFFDNTLQVDVFLKAANTRNNFGNRGAIGNAVSFDPTQSVFDSDSPYGGYTTWTIANGNPQLVAPTNPVALLYQTQDHSNVNRYITNATVDYRLKSLPELHANLNLGYDYSKGEGTVIVDTLAAFAFDDLNGGGVNNQYNQTKKNSLFEFYLNYKKQFGRHHLDVLAGYSWQHFEIGNYFLNSDAAGTPSETTEGSDPAEYYLLSYYGRINYDLDRKYLLTVTLRRDGTSRFSPENRWGLFPAVALAAKVVDNGSTFLKLRAGWGITGQQDIGDFYAYLARYQASFDNARYQFGNEFVTTLRPNGYDSNIKWEETSTINLAVDFSFYKDRLGGAIEVYQRDTKDLLNTIPVPAGTNLTNFITTNVGDMENKGIELTLTGTPYLTEKNSWFLSFNIARNKSKITKLTAVDDPDYQGILVGGIAGGVGSTIQIHSVGFDPSSFYVFEQLYDEDGNILEGQFADRNGDGIVNGDDKYRYQKPAADYLIGFSSELILGKFSFSFAGRGNIGNYVYNNVETDAGYLKRLYGSSGVLFNVHQSAVDNNVQEQGNLTFSDHFVQKASFLRMDHITVGYDLGSIIGESFTVYGTVQNPFVITGYKGIDPETFGGIDNNVYPRAMTISFGINLEF